MPENWFTGFCLISIFIISPFLFLFFNALLSNATEKSHPLWKRVFAWAGMVLFFVGTIHEGNKALLRPYHYLLAILSFAFLIVFAYLWASQS